MTKRRKWRTETLWLVIVLVVILLGLYWVPGRDRDKKDTYSPTPRGKSAFYALVKRYVSDTRRHERQLLPKTNKRVTLVVLGPARYPKEAEWKALHGWVSDGNTLVFAARYAAPMVDTGPFGIDVVPNAGGLSFRLKIERKKRKQKKVRDLGDAVKDALEKDKENKRKPPKDDPDKGIDLGLELARGTKSHKIKVRTKLVGGDIQWYSRAALKVDPRTQAQVLVDSDSGVQAVTARVGKGRVVVVASDEIFSNYSHLLEGDHPWLAWRLFEQRGVQQPVRFDEFLNVTGTPKVFGQLFSPMLRPITLQLILCAVLFGWWGFRRFGPPRPPGEAPRRSIVEHAEALGNLHFRAGTGARSVAAYLEYWKGELHLGTAGNQAEQIRQLAWRVGLEPAEVTRILERAHRGAQQLGLPTAQATQIIRELSSLKKRAQRTARGTHGD